MTTMYPQMGQPVPMQMGGVMYQQPSAPMQLTQAPPVHQTMVDQSQVRPAIVPANGSSETLLYMAYGTKKTPCCMCCPYVKISFNAFQKSTYVKVYDNKIEWNEPGVYCTPRADNCLFCNLCNGSVFVTDDVRVLYYDRHIMQRVDPAGCCSPMCTHNKCCPGEGIVLQPPVQPCCNCNGCCNCKCGRCCEFDLYDGFANSFTGRTLMEAFCAGPCTKPHRLITHIDNPQALAEAINKARINSHVKYVPYQPANPK